MISGLSNENLVQIYFESELSMDNRHNIVVILCYNKSVFRYDNPVSIQFFYSS